MAYLELITAAIGGGTLASLITAFAMRRRITAEAEQIEQRIYQAVLQSFQTSIDFLNKQVALQQEQIKAQQEQIKAQQVQIADLQKANKALREKLESYKKDTGYHKVVH